MMVIFALFALALLSSIWIAALLLFLCYSIGFIWSFAYASVTTRLRDARTYCWKKLDTNLGIYSCINLAPIFTVSLSRQGLLGQLVSGTHRHTFIVVVVKAAYETEGWSSSSCKPAKLLVPMGWPWIQSPREFSINALTAQVVVVVSVFCRSVVHFAAKKPTFCQSIFLGSHCTATEDQDGSICSALHCSR